MHSSDSGYDLPPFPAFPSIERYVGLGSVQDAVDRIERSILAQDAISVVIGPPGTGKTLISELLASRRQNSHRVISLGETPLVDSDSFLRRVLHQAGADIQNAPGGDLQLALFDHICMGDRSDQRLLLLIDEAQSLTPEVLEAIRTLTNLKRDGFPRVSVVMFGGNHLDELLIAPSMDGFRQRISTRCYLHPLNHEETNWYINQTIRNCGCDPEATITADAISAVHHACSGVPRLINQLLTFAIDFAAEKDEHLITDRIIDQSWAEVQQLPSPMVDEPEINITASTVEFGELDSFDAPLETQSEINNTSKAFDPICADTNPPATTCDTNPNAYDFEPESHLATTTEHVESAGSPPNSDQATATDPELHTEVWGDEQDITLQDGPQESTTDEISGPSTHAFHDDQLEIDDLGTPHLEYPQLACPALPTGEAWNADDLNTALYADLVKTQTSEELFGNFDEEEEIELHTVTTPAETEATKPAATLETVLPQEVVIHQEIIGISELTQIGDDDKIQYCDDAHQMPRKMHFTTGTKSSHDMTFENAHTTLDEPSADSATLDLLSAQDGHTIEFEAAELHEQKTDSVQHGPEQNDALRDPKTQPKPDLLAIRHDDSDLLIIEDEVDIHRIDKRQNSVKRSYHSTNYKRMLQLMRSHN